MSPACAAAPPYSKTSDVRVLLGEEHVARARVELQRDLVRHRRRRQEDRRLLTEQRRDAVLRAR